MSRGRLMILPTIGILIALSGMTVDVAYGLPPFAPGPAPTFTPLVLTAATPSPTPEATTSPTVAPSASLAPSPTIRATPAPTRAPRATPRPAPAPTRVPVSRSSVSGVATWYCDPAYPSPCTVGFPAGGAYAAAGPALRAALGNWRGRTVWVNGVPVRLIDFCGCGGDHVIDVYHATWVKIPHPDRVAIRW